MRVAVYYVPARDDPLWMAGCVWLGRDPEQGRSPAQPDVPGLAEVTVSPRRYGFHATLKAPMRLATSWEAFRGDAALLAAETRPFVLPKLAVTRLAGFLALCCDDDSVELTAFADRCVADLDRHRAPLTEAERDRRLPGLDHAERAHLERWGYPYVFDRFRFHMTLAERLGADRIYDEAAEAWFAKALGRARRVEGIALVVEDAPGEPFRLVERLPFGGA